MVLDRLRVHRLLNRQQIQSEVSGHCGLCSAKNKNQLWRAWFLVQLPGTVFHLSYTISLTLTHSKTGSRVYYLILLISDSALLDVA